MANIRINQMGYKSISSKQVVYVGRATDFLIFDIVNDSLVYEGKLEFFGMDETSKDELSKGDFSDFKEAGSYCIRIGMDTSRVFEISDNQNQVSTDTLLKAFYYQRCGAELPEELAGPWHHGSCHLQDSYVYHPDAEELIKSNPAALEKIDSSGGWHDAGDYGRYTVAAAKAIADLLLAYEDFPHAFNTNLAIPESHLEGSDILHEVRYELDFLFKMQRKSDGAVYTKVATRYFPAMIMPEDDLTPLFIFDISSPATAAYAAAMAMAARVYKKHDSLYADRCLQAAVLAYKWLEANPDERLFKNPTNVVSGEYGDITDIDERYWAAGELYRTTGEDKYHNDFIKFYSKLKDKSSKIKYSLGWSDVGGYGAISYIFTEQKTNNEVYEDIKSGWLSYAKEIEDRSKLGGYGISLDASEYIWGSNMILLNQSIHLIIANKILKNKSYDFIIERNWDYLFGVNPMDISYVTGLGEDAIMAPHHRPSDADGVKEPVPGLVSGGPCTGLYDDAAKEMLQGQAPAKCFVDHVGSYSTNEITIYWNSPAVYVGAYLV